MLQADGKILVGGPGNNIGGQFRDAFARLDAATGAPDSFTPQETGASGNGITLQADGKILFAGSFSNVGGRTRTHFVRLANDTAALQNLSVTESTVIWTRGGSSPQIERVLFELSYDNVNYSSLGAGTPSGGSDWTLTGLSLPTGQNIYVRARGFHRGGIQNGSQSLTETVRNTLLGAPLIGISSRKIHNGTTFDLPLALNGTPTVGSRNGGATGDFQLIFNFDNTVASVGNATVTSGTGSVSSQTIGANTHNYIVNLTGVTRITVTLTSVTDSTGNTSGSLPISMGVLYGDSNGDGVINSGDTIQARSRSGQPTNATNFRTDFNIDGTINSGDAVIVRSRSGTFIP